MKRQEQKETRRSFIGKVILGAAGLSGLTGLYTPVQALSLKKSATDRVLLGKSGVKVSRLGMGTGSNGGSVQRRLGQTEFTRLIRYGLDRGITFFDTADDYDGMHDMLREALKGVSRDKYEVQCKIPYDRYDEPLKEIDRYRREVGVDYIDSLLIHHVTTSTWPKEQSRLMDLLETAKEKGHIRSHGVSIHGLDPLAAAVGVEWIDIALVRVNHDGTHMDGTSGPWSGHGNRDAALVHIKKIHQQKAGVIGMKLIGNGNFTDPSEREKSIRFVMSLDFVDSVIIGFKSPAEIDEAIQRIDTALNV